MNTVHNRSVSFWLCEKTGKTAKVHGDLAYMHLKEQRSKVREISEAEFMSDRYEEADIKEILTAHD